MAELKYPIGIQSFAALRTDGYVYVDKTAFIVRMVKEGKYYFLSRPRRFGKSLLLSTIQAYFEGRRELFKGLAIDSADLSWDPRPVIHIDLNAENYRDPEALRLILNRRLGAEERKYGIETDAVSFSERLEDLIMTAFRQTGKRVVILVDEYDKPLLDIEDQPELRDNNQAVLKGFFSVLKSFDEYIEFALLTGVARFSKVSIFSDLNNLHDISFSRHYADICGWTEKELVEGFRPGIDELGENRGTDFDHTLSDLRRFYDGYVFAPGGSKLYNPFSVSTALSEGELSQYWFTTGTPTFLARRVMEAKVNLFALDSVWCPRASLQAIGTDSYNLIPLLFQTGYLTIKSFDEYDCELHFPNYEVENGFASQLFRLYLPEASIGDTEFDIRSFRDDLISGEPDSFMKRLQSLLKDVGYGGKGEVFYRNIIYLIFVLLGFRAVLERYSNKGRTDLEVRLGNAVYIFEFKYNHSAREAMAQIHDRDYAGRFASSTRKVYLIGANFSDKAQGLEAWEIERFK